MRHRLSDTLAALKRFPSPSDFGAHPAFAAPSGRLTSFTDFGSNPGDLDAWTFVPQGVAHPPLVVVLHGCTQTAAGYDHGSGWSELAERFGFAVLFAEQRIANNPNRCFNWFRPGDVRRGHGEVSSIVQMTKAAIARFDADPARVFVTGLSAGGAMTSAILATYPDVFAGGAIIAGLPFGSADNVPEALERMRGHGHETSSDTAARIRRASRHAGPWPTVSVWHGSADTTVHPVNADAIVGQWRALHGLAEQPGEEDRVDGHPRRLWRDGSGRIAIEELRITGMGHGTPIAPVGVDGLGAAIPHMLDVGISSTRHIADRWGLLKRERARPRPVDRPASANAIAPSADNSVQQTIEAALRSAGLLR